MTDASEPTSTKPYFIRAVHEWCSDNGLTPYLAVSVDARTLVPREHVKGGEIVLNVSHNATGRLQMGNELITFQARFGGVARDLSIPVENVTAIYARENGHGMAFEVPKAPAVPDESQPAPVDEPARPAPSLSAVPDASGKAEEPEASDATDEPPPPDPDAPKGGRPRLTRVK